MEIVSSAFKNGDKIPRKYTCQGENISPPLSFKNIPSEAKSMVLLVEDPDASTVKPWTHWLVFNIPPNSKGFDENAITAGCVEGLSTGNLYGYEGPCPPSGTHHYHFKLFALNSMLNLSQETDRKRILKEMEGKIIEEAVLMGLYQKEMSRQMV